MKKKMIALLLASTLIATGITPAYAAEFSDGSEFVEAQEPAFGTSPEDFTFTDEEAVPVVEETVPVEAATAIGGDMYTINFDAEIVLDQTEEFVRLLNIEREKLGVPPVQIDQQMMETAIKRAPETAVLYEHKDPVTGNDVTVPECLNMGTYRYEASSAIYTFKKSPRHWSALTNANFTRIGSAICSPTPCSMLTVCLATTQDGEYIPYKGSFSNYKKNFTQNINSKLMGSLSGEAFIYESLKIGEIYHAKPVYKAASYTKSTYINSITGGYWKSLTPDIVSVDQNGKVTALAPGIGKVHYYIKNRPNDYHEELFDVSEDTFVKPSIKGVSGKVVNRTKAFLKWRVDPNANGYEIYKYNDSSKKYQLIKKITDYTDIIFEENLGYGKTAKYKVRSYAVFNGETFHSKFSPVKTLRTATASPNITKISSSKGKISLHWKRPAGTEGYQIYRKAGANGTYKRIKTITNGKTVRYTDSKLKKGTTYSYKIRTYRKEANGKNIYSKWSKVVVKTCK